MRRSCAATESAVARDRHDPDRPLGPLTKVNPVAPLFELRGKLWRNAAIPTSVASGEEL